MGGLWGFAAQLLQTGSHGSTAAPCRHAACNQTISTTGGLASLIQIEPEVMLAAFLLDRIAKKDL